MQSPIINFAIYQYLIKTIFPQSLTNSSYLIKPYYFLQEIYIVVVAQLITHTYTRYLLQNSLVITPTSLSPANCWQLEEHSACTHYMLFSYSSPSRIILDIPYTYLTILCAFLFPQFFLHP